MKILIYSASKNKGRIALLKEVRSVVAEHQLDVSGSTDLFIRALLKHRQEMPIVLVQVNDKSELMDLEALKDLLEGLFLIVVTADTAPETATGIRRLYPRLVCRNDLDREIMTQVITKQFEMAADGHNAASRFFGTI